MVKKIKTLIQFLVFVASLVGAHLLVSYVHIQEEKMSDVKKTEYVDVHESVETIVSTTGSIEVKSISDLCIEYKLREDLMTAIIMSKRNNNLSLEDDFKQFLDSSEMLTKKKTYIKAYTDTYGDDSIHDLYNTYYKLYKTNIQ